MAYEHKDMTGSLWKNDYKKQPNQPDLKGKINVDGQMFDISAWKKQTQDGKNFLSLSIQPPYQPPESSVQNGLDKGDEQIPF